MQNKPPRRPALHAVWLNPIYDFVLFCSGLGPNFKRKITVQANLPAINGGIILDIGAGTGTHVYQLAIAYPTMQVVALEPDETLFKKKEMKNISYQNSLGEKTGLPNASVDYVFSTLVFHHLTLTEKKRVLTEIARIMKPNGIFILTDWGRLTLPFFAHYLYLIEDKTCIEVHFDGRTDALMRELGWHRISHRRVKLSGIWSSKWKRLGGPNTKPNPNTHQDY